MKTHFLFIALFVILLIIVFSSNIETFRRGRRRRHHRRHHRGRRWYHRFYDWNPWYFFSGLCKNGCTNIGYGNWGCQYPGTGPNDCVFATDCTGCGTNRRWYY